MLKGDFLMAGTVKINTICPGCFAETGHSIVMQEKEGIYYCPKNPEHRYKRNADGFLEKTDSW